MIRVSINGHEEELNGSSTSWIREQFHNRRRNGCEIWFQVRIKTNNVQVVLSSVNAPREGGGGRPPNRHEEQVFNEWHHHGAAEELDRPDALCRFLEKLQHILN